MKDGISECLRAASIYIVCFTCPFYSLGVYAESIVYEAEMAANGEALATNHSGFTGNGFIDYLGEGFIDWDIDVATAGQYDLIFRYALSRGDRPLNILVDGQIVQEAMSFPASGRWDTWSTVSVSLPLSVGTHSVRTESTGVSGANIDSLTVDLVAANEPPASNTPQAIISARGSAIIFNEAVNSASGHLEISNIAYEQLWFSQSGNDLQIDIVDSDEQIIINGWYLGSAYQFDGIEASDGRVLARDQVDQLVNAMAVFAIPEGVGAVIPQSTLDNLLQVWPSVWISSP